MLNMKQQLNETQSICCDDESSVGGVLLLVAPQALLSFLFLSAAQVPLTSSSHKFLSHVQDGFWSRAGQGRP